jgi:hypothetical protein
MADATQTPMARPSPLEAADLALEVVILLIFGVFMLLFGALLPWIDKGALPYSPDGAYGLFLVLTAFQVITMGKTPFGDMRRSWLIVLAGGAAALLGMASCFIPGRLSEPVRLTVGTLLFAGGTSLLLQLAFSPSKAKVWLRRPGIPRHLTLGCGLVYMLSMALGLFTLRPGIVPNDLIALLLLVDGASLFYLAWAIQTVSRSPHPEDRSESPVAPGERRPTVRLRLLREVSLSLFLATLVLLAVLLTFLGLVLIPVNLGLLQFSPDGLQGLLLVVFAIQIMSLGHTPVGGFRRSWTLVAFGILFVGLGAFSCLVPGILTHYLRLLLALLNLAAGTVSFIRRFRQNRHAGKNPRPEAVPPLVLKLQTTQKVLDALVIAFGVAMFAPGLVPGLLNAVIILANGLFLIRLATILKKLEIVEAAS